MPADVQKKMNALYPLAVHGDAHPINDEVATANLKVDTSPEAIQANAMAVIARTLETALRDPDKVGLKVALDYAKEGLDRILGKPVQQQIISGTVEHQLSEAEIERRLLEVRAKRAALGAIDVIS